MSAQAPVIAEETKERIRHHSGYLQVQASQTFVLGVPAAVQTQFQIEGAMNRLLPSAVPRLFNILDRLDTIEDQMGDDLDLLAVTKVDEIDIRPDEFVQLVKQYLYWRAALCNLFGVPPNPYDQRFAAMGGQASANVPVLG